MEEKNQQALALAFKRAKAKSLKIKELDIKPDLDEDTVDALIKTMNCNTFFGPVNIGSTEEITMLDLAHTIINLTNSSSKIEFYPRPENDPVRRKPDISLATEILKWHFSTPLNEGLQRTIQWIKRN